MRWPGWLLGLNGVGILALAGVTYVSSSGVISSLLEDLHRLGNRETPAVLAVLVLEDFAMAVYLPLVAVLGAGGGWLLAIVEVAAAIAALCMAFAASYRWGHHVGRLMTHPDSEQLLLRVLGITLIVAALAEHLHASAAVGAFLVGLTLTGETAERARKAAWSAARPVRRDLLRRGRAAGESRTAVTGAPDSPDPGRGHRSDEGGHRSVRGPARGSGAARPVARRHHADSPGRIFADHHRPGRLVDRRGCGAGHVVCVRVGDRGAGGRPVHRAPPGTLRAVQRPGESRAIGVARWRPQGGLADVQRDHLPSPASDPFDAAGDGVDATPAAVAPEHLGRGEPVRAPDRLQPQPAQHRRPVMAGREPIGARAPSRRGRRPAARAAVRPGGDGR